MSAISSTAGLSGAAFSISGLATGIDTDKIIQGLLAVNQQQVAQLQAKQNAVTSKQSAFKGVEARLLALQSTLGSMSRAVSSTFDSKTAVSSDETTVNAAASSSAATGVYAFHVNSVAQAAQIASQGFEGASSTITQGSLQIRVGNGATTTITIDGTNNTLQSLADAINSSGAEVSAAIVKDGSAGATPFRLLLSARKGGQDNSITVTNNLGADANGAVRPVIDSVVQQATSASITIGSGAGAVTVLNDSNTIADLFPGLTLNLRGADPARLVTVTVSQDTESATKAVTDFVSAYNDLMGYIGDQTHFEPQSGDAGVLLGNRSATSVQDDITRAVTEVVAAINPQMNHLSAAGIALGSDGRLTVDSFRLNQVLNGQVSGVTIADVRRLFALDGQSSSTGISFVTGGTRTKASTVPYQVDVTRAAERAAITAANALSNSTVIDQSNNTLSLTVDGRSTGDITLPDGTYTPTALAQALQAQINASSALAGHSVTVSVDGSLLKIASSTYGSSSEVTLSAGSALTILGFDGATSGRGQDVAGNFIVNGVVETATGSGQFLTGVSGNANTADLQVRVTLASGQVQDGADANLTVTRGIASRLNQVLDGMLDPVNGRLKAIDDSFQSQVDDLKKAIDRQNARTQEKQDQLVQQFAAMESIVSQLKSQNDFLTAQFAALKPAK